MSTRQYLSMVAREDLSNMQYKIVNVHDANGIKLRVAAGAGVLGVLNNKPQSGEHATVVVGGLTRCVAGATMAAGSWVTVTASGTGTAATSGDYILGKSITGCASGSNFQLLVQHNGYRG
jgi:hypothetical protein|tara:strand:- start:293 stop:652 length:360 start_codon:yes stop_codon:yes gene_type:complete